MVAGLWNVRGINKVKLKVQIRPFYYIPITVKIWMWLKNSQDTSVEDVKVSGEVRGDLLEFDLPVEGGSGVIDIYGMALART